MYLLIRSRNTVLSCTALYYTVLYYSVLYCSALYCTVLYCTVPYCTVLYATASPPYDVMPCRAMPRSSLRTNIKQIPCNVIKQIPCNLITSALQACPKGTVNRMSSNPCKVITGNQQVPAVPKKVKFHLLNFLRFYRFHRFFSLLFLPFLLHTSLQLSPHIFSSLFSPIFSSLLSLFLHRNAGVGVDVMGERLFDENLYFASSGIDKEKDKDKERERERESRPAASDTEAVVS